MITDIYGAGEENTANLTGETLQQAIAHHQDEVYYHADFHQLPPWLAPQLRNGDLVLFLGAGNLNQIIDIFLNESFPE